MFYISYSIDYYLKKSLTKIYINSISYLVIENIIEEIYIIMAIRLLQILDLVEF